MPKGTVKIIYYSDFDNLVHYEAQIMQLWEHYKAQIMPTMYYKRIGLWFVDQGC